MSASTHRHSGSFPQRRRARGQAQVEFALVIVFLMILILSMLELLTLMHTYNVLADAAKEGLRYAIVHGTQNSTPSPPTGQTACLPADIDAPAAPPGTLPGYGSVYGVVKTYVQYSLHDMTGITVAVTYPDTANPPANQAPNRVQVVVAYPY